MTPPHLPKFSQLHEVVFICLLFVVVVFIVAYLVLT